MANRDHFLSFLKDLPPPERAREVKQALTDALQELVACVEKRLPLGGNTIHGCVIDDFQPEPPDLTESACHVRLRFSASARQGIAGAATLETITGRAEAVIDDAGQVAFRDVRFAEDPAFIANDVGGGD